MVEPEKPVVVTAVTRFTVKGVLLAILVAVLLVGTVGGVAAYKDNQKVGEDTDRIYCDDFPDDPSCRM